MIGSVEEYARPPKWQPAAPPSCFAPLDAREIGHRFRREWNEERRMWIEDQRRKGIVVKVKVGAA